MGPPSTVQCIVAGTRNPSRNGGMSFKKAWGPTIRRGRRHQHRLTEQRGSYQQRKARSRSNALVVTKLGSRMAENAFKVRPRMSQRVSSRYGVTPLNGRRKYVQVACELASGGVVGKPPVDATNGNHEPHRSRPSLNQRRFKPPVWYVRTVPTNAKPSGPQGNVHRLSGSNKRR